MSLKKKTGGANLPPGPPAERERVQIDCLRNLASWLIDAKGFIGKIVFIVNWLKNLFTQERALKLEAMSRFCEDKISQEILSNGVKRSNSLDRYESRELQG